MLFFIGGGYSSFDKLLTIREKTYIIFMEECLELYKNMVRI